jgi:hypothetical protein
MATPNMNLTLPSEGASSGVWDELLNDALDLVDAHDHSTGKGPKVTQAGINLTGDLEHNGNSATELKSVEFSLVASASMAGRVRGLWFNSADNELYIRTNGGADIKLTSGGALNISITGAIGGDYSSVSALLDYDDATDTYRLRQQVGAAVRQYGKAATGGVDLYEYKAQPAPGVPTTRVRLSSPAALGASYELVFAGALPGSTQLMQVSAAGVLTYSNTVSGLITASAGLTAGAGAHITVSGAGEFKHGDRVKTFLPRIYEQPLTPWTLGGGGYIQSASGTQVELYLDGFDVGDRIKSVTLSRYGDGAADCTATVSVGDSTTMTTSSIGSAVVTNAPASWATTTIDVTDTTMTDTTYIRLSLLASAANWRCGSIRVTYDRP